MVDWGSLSDFGLLYDGASVCCGLVERLRGGEDIFGGVWRGLSSAQN